LTKRLRSSQSFTIRKLFCFTCAV